MKMLFVFNPNSGKAQIKNQLMKIIQVFSKAGTVKKAVINDEYFFLLSSVRPLI